MEQPIEAPTKGKRLLIVDDDDLTRELLKMVGTEAGFVCADFSSGEAAVDHLVSAPVPPDAVLCDLQMPGTCGPALAERLRRHCGRQTVLLAMSGSTPAVESTFGYDVFLRKPFSADGLRHAFEDAASGDEPGETQVTREAEGTLPALDWAVYAKYAAAMPPAQLAGLYAMCLDDAEKRVAKMRLALSGRDDAEWRKSAHAIKGGCGMVGALELARLASAMEQTGLPPVNDDAPLLRIMDAAAQLKRILETP